MSRCHTPLVEHTFQGPRFRDHGLPLEVLSELLVYRDLVVELAKILWKRNNPGRERLPKNFEETLTLKFYEVAPNCATIPLVAGEPALDDQAQLPLGRNELELAVELVAQTLEAASANQHLPQEFPRDLLDRFQDYGKTLQAGEWIEQRPAGSPRPVRYDFQVRDQLLAAMKPPYEDTLDLIAEVTMARVSRPRMLLLLRDGREVEAPFRPEDELTITTALKDHTQAKIRLFGQGQFAPDGKLTRVLEVSRIDLLPEGVVPFDPTAKPIWEVFADLAAQEPPETFDRLPTDGSYNIDHYLYGAPKK